MVWGDGLALTAQNDPIPASKVADLKEANRLEPYWPDTYTALAGAYQYASVVRHERDLLAKARPWSVRAAQADPYDPLVLVDIGNLDFILGQNTLAVHEYREALLRDPWTANAFGGLAQVANVRHQWRQELHYLLLERMVSPSAGALEQPILKAELNLDRDREGVGNPGS